jgi:hypothetical protein
MKIQEQKLSALVASNVSTMLYSQKNAKPQFLSFSPTSIITVITSSSYGIASLSTSWALRGKKLIVGMYAIKYIKETWL